MAQVFSQRYAWNDGPDNTGSRDGEGAAGMPYTGARLPKMTSLLLNEIDEGCPIGRIGKPLDDTKAQGPAVSEPAVELRLRQVLECFDEHGVRRTDGRVGDRHAVYIPICCRGNKTADQAPVNCGQVPGGRLSAGSLARIQQTQVQLGLRYNRRWLVDRIRSRIGV